MKQCLTGFLIFCFSFILMAGDAAEFCSIGWSNDYQFYAFAQYGEQDGSGFPYAELYVVDIEKNNFVPGGIFKLLFDRDVTSRGINALLDLRVEADSLLNAFGILSTQHLRPVVSNKNDEIETAQWSLGSNNFSIKIEQAAKGNPGILESEAAFHLLLKRGDDPVYVIGNNRRFRKYVIRYDMDHILQSPDARFLVVVIRITKLGFEGPDIRYMVETIKLP